MSAPLSADHSAVRIGIGMALLVPTVVPLFLGGLAAFQALWVELPRDLAAEAGVSARWPAVLLQGFICLLPLTGLYLLVSGWRCLMPAGEEESCNSNSSK